MLCTSPNHSEKYITMLPINNSLYVALIRLQITFTQCTADTVYHRSWSVINYAMHFSKLLCRIINHAAYKQ